MSAAGTSRSSYSSSRPPPQPPSRRLTHHPESTLPSSRRDLFAAANLRACPQATFVRPLPDSGIGIHGRLLWQAQRFPHGKRSLRDDKKRRHGTNDAKRFIKQAEDRCRRIYFGGETGPSSGLAEFVGGGGFEGGDPFIKVGGFNTKGVRRQSGVARGKSTDQFVARNGEVD